MTCKKISSEVAPLVYKSLELSGNRPLDLRRKRLRGLQNRYAIKKMKVGVKDIWATSCGSSFAIEVNRWLKLLLKHYRGIKQLCCKFNDASDRFRCKRWHFSELLFLKGILRCSRKLSEVLAQRQKEGGNIAALRFVASLDSYPNQSGCEEMLVPVDKLLRMEETARLARFNNTTNPDFFNQLDCEKVVTLENDPRYWLKRCERHPLPSFRARSYSL